MKKFAISTRSETGDDDYMYFAEFSEKPTVTQVNEWLKENGSDTCYEEVVLIKEVPGVFTQPDVRNKLTPITNLIALVENGFLSGPVEKHLVQAIREQMTQEIEQCKKSIAYLSGTDRS